MSEKKQSFKKNSKCRKIFEMLKVDPKTANLATLQNFSVIEKRYRFRNQGPKINKI